MERSDTLLCLVRQKDEENSEQVQEVQFFLLFSPSQVGLLQLAKGPWCKIKGEKAWGLTIKRSIS